MDIMGPYAPSAGQNRYAFVVTDDYSRFVHVFLLKHRSDAFKTYKRWHTKMATQFNRNLAFIRCDGAKEFNSKEFNDFLDKCGTTRELSFPESHQQNGVAEAKNQKLQYKLRTLLSDSGLDSSFWGEGVKYLEYTINRTYSSVTKCTPFERWYGRKPDISHLRPFGSKAVGMVKRPDDKISPRGVVGIMVGYSIDFSAYRIYVPSLHKVQEFRNAKFDETDFPSSKVDKKDKPNATNTDSETSDDDTGGRALVPTEPRRSQRIQNRKRGLKFLAGMAVEVVTPTTFEEAMNSPQVDQWKESIKQELENHEKAGTFQFVPYELHMKLQKCKWVFKLKLNSQTSQISAFKSRLVFVGAGQRPGIDYDEVFTPTVRMETVRILLALAAKYHWFLRGGDFKAAYLQSDIDTDLFAKPPPGMMVPNGMVLKLRKCCYGAKQAGRLWNQKLVTAMLERGFKKIVSDPSTFVLTDQDSHLYCLLFVDDYILASNDKKLIQKTERWFAENFTMSFQGELESFLGLTIQKNDDGIFISQQNYINELEKRFEIVGDKKYGTPTDPSVKLLPSDQEQGGETADKTFYQQLIGGLLYSAMTVRADIAWSVITASRFSNNPTTKHLKFAKQILRYLVATKNYGLLYSSDDSGELVGYCDASWASDAADRKSVFGNVFLLSNGAISWKSTKSKTIMMSSAEAEYTSLAEAGNQALWLKKFI